MKTRKSSYLILTAVLIVTITTPLTAQRNIPSPEEHFGFQMGADGKLANWNEVVKYFELLDLRSERIKVQDLGPSTLDNPFLIAYISSAANLRNLERYRTINKQLTDPRGLNSAEIDRLIQQGKYISAQTYSLHSTEVGGTQCVSELAYDLITAEDNTTKMIRENTIFLMFPCFNPDGLNMVADWFYKYQDTEFNNTSLPYMYHFYTGHDDNRDSYMLTQNESRMFAKIVYRDWQPQSFVDHHHMGGGGARFYVPPYLDPIHPNVDPLIWREHQLYGAHIAVALEQADKSGFETGAPYTGWWQASFHMSTNYHNIAGMLTESASANWCDPVFVMPDQLGSTRGRPEYQPQMTMPRLWPGGWWRLRDIVEQQIISSKAVLELGARYKEKMLRNSVRKAMGNIERGQDGPPYAYILPKDQHDFLSAVKLARTFQLNGIEIHKLDESYQVGSQAFAPGSFVIACAQPLRAFVVSFLEQVNYPDNTWTRQHTTQDPIRPYDLAGYSVSEHMGVEAIPMLEPLRDIQMTVIKEDIAPPAGHVDDNGRNAYIFERRFNDSFKAANRFWDEGASISVIEREFTMNGKYFAPGAFMVQSRNDISNLVEEVSKDLGLDFYVQRDRRRLPARRLEQPRLGLYKRFAGGNMDEGWTNWMLQDFEFEFDSLFNEDIRDDALAEDYDVIILPSDSYSRMVNGNSSQRTPPEFRGGMEQAGLANIREFVENGGILITLNQSADFARQVFNLPITYTIAGVPSRDFYCPGSTVKISVDTEHPLGYGFKPNVLGLYRSSPVLTVRSGSFEDKIGIAAKYHEENILQSGWLIGEKYLAGKSVIMDFQVGKGKVVVLALPVQHRAQMHGTYKFLFNAICY